MRRRWDGDERGVGIADGAAMAGQVDGLLAALAAPNWVAEAPEEHLLPTLRRACAGPASPWTIGAAVLGADGVYAVELAWSRPGGSRRRLRADAFALVGVVAEATTHVREIPIAGGVAYAVATGMLDGDGPFAGHGHLLLLRVSAPGLPPA